MAKFCDTCEVVRRPPSSVISVLPGREQEHLAGICDALEYIVFGQPYCTLVESEFSGQHIGMRKERGARFWRDFGDRQCFCHTGLGDVEALFDHLLALGRTGIGGYLADAQVIVGEDAVAACPEFCGARLGCANVLGLFRRARWRATAPTRRAVCSRSVRYR